MRVPPDDLGVPGLNANHEGMPALLRTLAERTAWASGAGFFREVVRGLSETLEVPCAFVTEHLPQHGLARPLAVWHDDRFIAAMDYALEGTPCATVLAGAVSAIADQVATRFPRRPLNLDTVPGESFLAVPLVDGAGSTVGHLAVVDQRPRQWSRNEIALMHGVSGRTAREVELLRREHEPRTDGAAALGFATREQVASMVHELRTPLNGILGFAQLLARDRKLDPGLVGAVTNVRQCGERLLALVNQIEDVATGPHDTDGGRLDGSDVGTPADADRERRDRAPQSGPADASSTGASDGLPAGMRERLLELSRLGDIAELNRCLDEAERRTGPRRVLAEVRTYARAFDMKAIRERLDRAADAS